MEKIVKKPKIEQEREHEHEHEQGTKENDMVQDSPLSEPLIQPSSDINIEKGDHTDKETVTAAEKGEEDQNALNLEKEDEPEVVVIRERRKDKEKVVDDSSDRKIQQCGVLGTRGEGIVERGESSSSQVERCFSSVDRSRDIGFSFFFKSMEEMSVDLDFISCMALSTVSKLFFELIKKRIETNYWFKHTNSGFLKYTPQKWRLCVSKNKALPPLLATHLNCAQLHRNNITSTTLLNLVYIKFGDKFNFSLDLSKCTNLRTLIIGKAFQRKLDLPQSLQELSLPDRLKVQVDYPPRLLRLEFTDSSGPRRTQYRPIQNLATLEELVLPISFDEDLKDICPPNLKKLSLWSSNATITAETLPRNLRSIIYTSLTSPQLIASFPPSVLEITFPELYVLRIPPLSPQITHLALPNCTPDFGLPNALVFLRASFVPPPSTCTHLQEFCFTANEPLNLHPNLSNLRITKLVFGDFFDQEVNGLLPSSIKYLRFGTYFDKSVSSLPENLEVLILGEYFRQIIFELPESLRELRFGRFFDNIIAKYPKQLLILEYGECYAHTSVILPKTLMLIVFPRFFHVYCNSETREWYTKLLPELVSLKYTNAAHELVEYRIYR